MPTLRSAAHKRRSKDSTSSGKQDDPSQLSDASSRSNLGRPLTSEDFYNPSKHPFWEEYKEKAGFEELRQNMTDYEDLKEWHSKQPWTDASTKADADERLDTAAQTDRDSLVKLESITYELITETDRTVLRARPARTEKGHIIDASVADPSHTVIFFANLIRDADALLPRPNVTLPKQISAEPEKRRWRTANYTLEQPADDASI